MKAIDSTLEDTTPRYGVWVVKQKQSFPLGMPSKKLRVALQEREETTFLKHLIIFYFKEYYIYKISQYLTTTNNISLYLASIDFLPYLHSSIY